MSTTKNNATKFFFGNEISKKLKKASNEGDVVLKKPKEFPTIEDIDGNLELLKDVIESCKLEKWKVDIKPLFATYCEDQWEFEISNYKSTIKISAKLRKDRADELPTVAWFNIRNSDVSSSGGSISYSTEKNKVENYLIIKFLWDFILEENENNINLSLSALKSSKLAIEKELVSLKRDRQLQKLL